MSKKFWKNFANFIIGILFFLFALSFYQVKSEDVNILPVYLSSSAGDKELATQFQLKIKVPKLIFKKQKSNFQFDLIQIDSNNVNNSIKTSGVISYDLYEKFSVNFETRLDLPGIQTDPSGVISQNFVENKTLTHQRDLLPVSQGIFQGTFWLYVNLIPVDPSNDPIHEILLAKPIQINVITIIGLSIIWVRIIIGILIIFSFFLRFKLFVEN